MFAREFPNLSRAIADMKKDNYAALAWEMQRSESNFVLQTVAKKIITNRPDVPLFSIHDSLLTTPENSHYVYSMLKQGFVGLGIEATLTTTDYGDPNYVASPRVKRGKRKGRRRRSRRRCGSRGVVRWA